MSVRLNLLNQVAHGYLWQLSTFQIAPLRAGKNVRLKDLSAHGHDGLQKMQSIKKLRAGGHDYAGTQMETIFAFCRATQVQLDAICDRVDAYALRVLSA
jgi:hypothetical protein